MRDLFEIPGRLEPVKMVGADVSYMVAFDFGASISLILDELIRETPWRQESVTIWGKAFKQPRLVAWYGDTGRSYSYSRILLDPLPWTSRLGDIRSRVEDVVSTKFNSVLLNYYRNQDDSMGLHSDDEPDLGEKPIIASLSLGAERGLIFKSKLDRSAKPTRITLASGSLLVMKDDTQKNYKHGILKESRFLPPRINLTFRQIIDK